MERINEIFYQCALSTFYRKRPCFGGSAIYGISIGYSRGKIGISPHKQGVFYTLLFPATWAFEGSIEFHPDTFQNQRKNWPYVSAYSGEDLKTVYKTYNKLVNLEYFKEIWVFKINTE